MRSTIRPPTGPVGTQPVIRSAKAACRHSLASCSVFRACFGQRTDGRANHVRDGIGRSRRVGRSSILGTTAWKCRSQVLESVSCGIPISSLFLRFTSVQSFPPTHPSIFFSCGCSGCARCIFIVLILYFRATRPRWRGEVRQDQSNPAARGRASYRYSTVPHTVRITCTGDTCDADPGGGRIRANAARVVGFKPQRPQLYGMKAVGVATYHARPTFGLITSRVHVLVCLVH